MKLKNSWRPREGMTAAKQAFLDLVARVTKEGAADFLPPEARVVVFDNDGTLWTEKTLPIQVDFRRLAVMGEQDQALRTRQPWKAVVGKIIGGWVMSSPSTTGGMGILAASLTHGLRDCRL